MRNQRVKILFVFVLLWVFACQSEIIEGKVVGVTDGDTITVLDSANYQHKIRLSGIDAPEKKQAFGDRSKNSLSEVVFGKPVSVETSKRDRYGRAVGKVLVNGIDANLEQIRKGLAWHYKQYQNEQSPMDKATYSAAEVDAKDANRGLWSDPHPVPPWEFRHSKAR